MEENENDWGLLSLEEENSLQVKDGTATKRTATKKDNKHAISVVCPENVLRKKIFKMQMQQAH